MLTACPYAPEKLSAASDPASFNATKANGVGVTGWRGASTVNAPLLAPGRTAISSQTALPLKAFVPKSGAVVKRPLVTNTFSLVIARLAGSSATAAS